MDEEETRYCPNCKREVPAVNFTIHSVHCARNIKVCPVCKEPVPSAELDLHHQNMHKLLPCKQCGESVCGTDLEDHIRDSCANTVKSCRFCELELTRRELPTHEGYCGVRTEQCEECKEFVMIKYKQLHLESNHGFLRLDDDPPPPKKQPSKPNLVRPTSNLNRPTNSPKQNNTQPSSIFDDFNRPSTSDRPPFNASEARNGASNTNKLTPSTFGMPRNRIAANLDSLFLLPEGFAGSTDLSDGMAGASGNRPGQSSFGTASCSRNDAQNPDDYVLTPSPSTSVGSNKKPSSSNSRPAASNNRPTTSNKRPPNSNSRPSPSISRPSSTNISQESANAFDVAAKMVNSDSDVDRNYGSGFICKALASYNNFRPEPVASVARTSNGVKKRTNDQPQINTDTSATKTVEKDLGVSRGAVKKRPAPAPPASSRRDLPYYSAMERQQREEGQRREQNEYNLAHGLPPVLNPAQKIEKLRKMDALHNREFEEPRRQRRLSPERGSAPAPQGHVLGRGVDEATRQEFKNLKPMSPTQFMKRFSSLQVSPPAAKSDRFPEIKSSLRELRRGLNEVTAPYNANNNAIAANNNNERVRSPSPRAMEYVQLPCEFCNVLVPADDLVQHQTGCRPDLAQYVPGGAVGGYEPPPPRARRPRDRGDLMDRGDPLANGDPVIPCEFCMKSLSVYLITEHQERCIQKNMPV